MPDTNSADRGVVPPIPEEVRLWRHRKGDMYLVVFPQIEGNPTRGFETVNYIQGKPHRSLAYAISAGFTDRESDDFNVWVIRRGAVVASLWMNEIVDDCACLMERYTMEAEHAIR